ncbi:aminopeptidase Ey-like [Pomacea canaliculata]|uniref:aminopeptidase Ey-like n=1 Tax=Pomacea canaliculata TaxID=400727 RepID=UPI000D732B63|nr:aminopeptidase Ey-like [Pomacea canaliculata]
MRQLSGVHSQPPIVIASCGTDAVWEARPAGGVLTISLSLRTVKHSVTHARLQTQGPERGGFFGAIAIAVLVGLIVHFAERDSYDRQVTCAFPETWRELFQQLFERLDDELKVGDQYSVDIAFSGPLTDDLAGLYLSSYKRGNDTVYLATTQFESPDAREAFPCFDEPALKAVFNVTLLRKPPLISLSNTRIRATEQRDNGFVADIYYPTPKMSTYLLAFIVCDFSHVNGTTKNGTEFGVWARSEFASSMEYALATGMSILDYYGTYFGTNFPLRKQDMIAIPDFANGAMENWGLITYRETALLYTPGVTSESYKQYVTDVIAHELAHQWFGNLVTLAWWDDLWLNEGFASYVEYIGMDFIDKNNSWKVWEQFATDVIQSVFVMDQLTTSHPLYVPVATVSEMEQYFDSISYEKGASVIRMIKFCLGEGTFQRGLQRYLRDHAYANANHTDLWRAWDEQARQDGQQINVAAIMDTWTLQMGFPVIRLTVSANGKVTATQKRFLINPAAKDPGRFQSPFNYRWHVPITITTSKMANFNVTEEDVLWLTPNDDTKELNTSIPTLSSNDWILGNIHQYGYYRVNYDTRNWEALIRQLQKDHQLIPPINRAQIIDDAWNLASAGETDIAVALGTLDYLDTETDYVPWEAAALQLGKLKTRLSNTDGYGALMRFITDKVKSPFTKLGFDDSKAEALESYTRVTVASLACGAGQRVRGLGSATLYKMEGDTKPSCWRCRCRTLDIKRDEGTGVIASVAANVNGRPLAWDFVRENWDTIIANFSQSASRLRGMTKTIADGFHTPYKLQQLKDFISSLASLQTAEQALKQAVETVEVNIRWHEEAYPNIIQWLEGRGYHKFEGSGSSSADKLTLEDILLPTNLRPEHYDITIQPDMEGPDPKKFTFNGTVTMTFTCVNATDKIVLHASMSGGNYSVSMNFKGDLSGGLDGFYLSSYVENNNTVPSGKVMDEFHPTKRMSTYLVAFLVSDFDKISGATATHNISLQRRRHGELGADHLPRDSSAHPGGNVVCLGQGERRHHCGPRTGHMWFGDLVSPQWWNDIWLNEGFATYLEFFGVDHVFPTWHEFDRFVLIAAHRAMDLDGLTSSHPLYVSVATTAEINEVFDDISYRKGASVIRMISHALGEQTFKKGLENFLRTHQYGNARHEDLWQALAQQAKTDNKSLDVAAVMDTWTLQMNFPLVTVRVSGQNSITVTQERYLSDPTATDTGKYKSPFGYKWDIPFTYTSSQELNFTLETKPVDWIKSSEASKVITARTGALPANGTGWVLGNVAQIGFYRVNYDVSNWERLAQQLKTDATKIHRVNRAQLINDAWNLAGAGHVSQEIALKIVEYLDNEEDDVPWSAAMKQLVFVDAMLSSTEIYGGFKSFIASKTQRLFRKLGMNDTGGDVPTSFLRSTIASFACGSDVSECVSQSLSLFADWKNDSSVNKISPEVRDTVYCTALRKGSVDDWDFLYERFQTEANVHEKNRLMNQLACSSQLWILSRLMDRAVLKGEVRAQDAISVLSGVIQNPIGTSLAWQFVRNNWDVIFKRYNNVVFTLTNLVKALAGRFNTRTQLEEVQNFIDTHPNLGTATRAFQAAVETTRNNIRWMDKNYDVVKSWLAASNYLA